MTPTALGIGAAAAPPAVAGPVAIIGAGPAGLGAAWELARMGLPAIVFERDRSSDPISGCCESTCRAIR